MSTRRSLAAAWLSLASVLTGAWMGLAFARHAQAAPVELQFTGTTTSTFGAFAGQGTQVSGTLSFDSAMVASGSSTTSFDEFRLSATENQSFAFSMEITVGAVTASTEGNGDPPFTLANLQQFDGGAGNPADAWFFSIPGDLAFFPSDASAQIELRTDGVSDALLPGSNGLTGSVLIPDQARFENATGSFQRRSNGSIDAGVTFELDTLTLPEPSSGSAIALGAVACLARVASYRTVSRGV